MKVLERLAQLIGMTASSSEEEARTMALVACRMIRQHGIVLLEPGDPRLRASANVGGPHAVGAPPVAPPAPSSEEQASALREFARMFMAGLRFAGEVAASTSQGPSVKVRVSQRGPTARRRKKLEEKRRRWQP